MMRPELVADRSRGRVPTPEQTAALIETIVGSLAPGSSAPVVAPAVGQGFAHYEIRCDDATANALSARVAAEPRGTFQDALQALRAFLAASGRGTRVTVSVRQAPAMRAVGGPTEGGAVDGLCGLLRFMAQALVDYPEDVVVFPAAGDEFAHFEVRCDTSDVGRLVGRRGVNADAVRTILGVAGESRGIRVTVHMTGRDGE